MKLCNRAVNLILSVGVVLFLVSGSALPARATVTSVTLASPGPGSYGEDDDYFTTVWGNPRDMDDPGDLYVVHSTCGGVAKWSSTSYSNGIWSGTTSTTGDLRALWVLNPGWPSSLNTGEDGQARPIDASRYRQLTFRMYSSHSGLPWAYAMFTDQQIGGSLSLVNFTVYQGWNIYTIDLGDHSSWTGSITGVGFELNSIATSGVTLKLDWVRLTPKQSRQITWGISGPSGDAQVYLGSDSTFADSEQYGRLRIYEGLSAGPQQTLASAASLSIPASFPGGTYYVRVVDDVAGANSSPNAWEFKPAPIAEIVAPSYYSGEDFATTVVGNSWDMGGVDDVDSGWTENLGYSASGGVLEITSNDDGMGDCAAPWPHRPLALNLGGNTIDYTKYKYFTYRYKVDNAPDQGAGGVSRVRWMSTAIWAAGRTDDISLYDDGWHTYSLDLTTVVKEGELGDWNFAADIMQIMAHESHNAWTSHLDWVRLTADNTASTADSYLVRWNLHNVTDVLTTTVYWATDRVSSTVVGSGEIVPTQTVSYTTPYSNNIFLPLVLRNYGSGSSGIEGEFEYPMSTGALSGDYYIAIKLEDGYNETWWFSELPVKIQ